MHPSVAARKFACPDEHGRAVTNRAMEARRRPRGPLPGLLALLLLLHPCGSQTVSSVVCVGDSITYGRTKVAEDGSDGYPHKLEARLGWSHWSVGPSRGARARGSGRACARPRAGAQSPTTRRTRRCPASTPPRTRGARDCSPRARRRRTASRRRPRGSCRARSRSARRTSRAPPPRPRRTAARARSATRTGRCRSSRRWRRGSAPGPSGARRRRRASSTGPRASGRELGAEQRLELVVVVRVRAARADPPPLERLRAELAVEVHALRDREAAVEQGQG